MEAGCSAAVQMPGVKVFDWIICKGKQWHIDKESSLLPEVKTFEYNGTKKRMDIFIVKQSPWSWSIQYNHSGSEEWEDQLQNQSKPELMLNEAANKPEKVVFLLLFYFLPNMHTIQWIYALSKSRSFWIPHFLSFIQTLLATVSPPLPHRNRIPGQ